MREQRLQRSVVLSFVAVLLLVGCVDHSPAGLQQIAQRASEERFGNGFAVVVIDGQGNRTTGVAGTLIDGTPMIADAPWVIGSVAKAFVATTVMQLVDEGSLTLGTRVGDLLDNEFIPDSTTVLDLLHHSSGIPTISLTSTSA